MNYHKLTELDIETEEMLLAKYREEIKGLPEGNMVCCKARDKQSYYLAVDGTRKYLNSKDSKLVDGIKRRHFLKRAIEVLERNISAQRKSLQVYHSYEPQIINALLPDVYRSFIAPNVDAIYTQNPDSALIHRTSFGLFVRSKSEALIAEVLHAEEITFEYERPLWLYEDGREVLIHPDFTIPCRDGMIYWEHMGMMGMPKYRTSAKKRFSLFTDNEITIPDKLIITMDTVDGAIDVLAIKLLADALRTLHDI